MKGEVIRIRSGFVRDTAKQPHVPGDLDLVFRRVQLSSLHGEMTKEICQGLLPVCRTGG